jgi:hypothetical protein
MGWDIKLEYTDKGYILLENLLYYSKRYDKDVMAFVGEEFDGATGAVDVCPPGWIAHDVLCRDGEFADGSICTNWQASMVLHDILKENGFYVRARTWFIATWLFGGGKARKNGLW